MLPHVTVFYWSALLQVCNPKLINHFLLEIFFPHLPYSEFIIIYIVFQLFPGDIPYRENSTALLAKPVSLLLQGQFEITVKKKKSIEN